MKIAVVGCSHTDLNLTDPNLLPPARTPNSYYSWLWHASEDNPNIHFDSYARSSQGSLYFDMCLKNIIQKDYDACIVQLTTHTRWILPTRKNKIVVDANTHNQIWETKHPKNNLTEHKLITNHATLQPEHWFPKIGDPKLQRKFARNGDFFKLATQTIFPQNNLPDHYSEIFINTLESLYGKFFKHFSYFTMWNQDTYANNIGIDQTGFNWMFDTLGKKYVVTKLFTDDWHLNYEGSKIFYTKFIKPYIITKLMVE